MSQFIFEPNHVERDPRWHPRKGDIVKNKMCAFYVEDYRDGWVYFITADQSPSMMSIDAWRKVSVDDVVYSKIVPHQFTFRRNKLTWNKLMVSLEG